MGRSKKRSKAKSASARTRVEGGQDGASETSNEVARREHESSLAVKLPTKVLERIVAELCPSTFGLDNFHYAWTHLGYLLGRHRALKFALVCKSWRDVGLAAFWRHAVVMWQGLAPAPQLATRSRQGLVPELSIIVPATGAEPALWLFATAMMAHVGEHLRALFLSDDLAVDVLAHSLPAGGFPSLVELHMCLFTVDLKKAYELFAHMPKLEYFNCGISYGRSPDDGTWTRPHMSPRRRRLARLSLRYELESPEAIGRSRVELDALPNLLYVADLSSLHELALHYNFSHAVPAHIMPLLRNLRILRLGVPAPLFPSFPPAFTSILADLPHLVCLDVELCRSNFGRPIGPIPPSDAASLLAALPLSLEVALIEFDFSLPDSTAHLGAFLERRLASGVLKRWTSVRGTRPDATLKTTWTRCGGGDSGEARWVREDFEESDASPRIV
ncbi:hypothetical protein JCM8208_004390 [Rhodotorula glutinis]